MTPDDRLLAAELSLGLIEGAERTAALERVLAEPDFAAEVAWWRRTLAPVLIEQEGAEPPADLEERIAALLADRPGDAPVAPAARELPASREMRPGRRWPWVASGGVLGAVAASVAAFLLLPPASPPVPVPVAEAPVRMLLVAPLAPTPEGTPLPAAVVVDRQAGAVQVVGEITVPAGRAAELWRIGADKTPHALGLVPADRGGRLRLTSATLPQSAETIAVSIEPAGGAPGPAPTGPVVATGVLQET